MTREARNLFLIYSHLFHNSLHLFWVDIWKHFISSCLFYLTYFYKERQYDSECDNKNHKYDYVHRL